AQTENIKKLEEEFEAVNVVIRELNDRQESMEEQLAGIREELAGRDQKLRDTQVLYHQEKSKLEGNFWYELSTTQKILIGTGIVALAFIGIGVALAVSAGEKNKCCKKSHKSDPNTEYLPKGRIDYLTAKQIEDLNHKTNMEEITDEEWDYMNDVSPEYAEDWLERDEGLRDMSLEEYDELRDFSDCSGIDFEDVVYWKS
ncbi:MAG: hypothetical protein K2N77_01725, partial [Lachnospiraceae bacterium]|nr:hypothetical protein [Lachnospiraceae bacterium]